MTFWGELLGIVILFGFLFVSGGVYLVIDREKRLKRERASLHSARKYPCLVTEYYVIDLEE